MLSRVSFTMTSLDCQMKANNRLKDRFIPKRTSLNDLDQVFENSTQKQIAREIEGENNENDFYQQVLKSNLQPSTLKPKSYTDLDNFNDGQIQVPQSNNKKKRTIDQNPFKVLDAPYLQDDYYLNVVDWSLNNNLAVGLANSVYIWNFNNNKVKKLSNFDDYNLASSVSWDIYSENLAIGTVQGTVEFWDVSQQKKLLTFQNHQERVGAVSLVNNYFVTGSRDRQIYFYDLRQSVQPIQRYNNHKQEVCGLKWCPNKEYFASGGNDNKFFVYSPKTSVPIMKKTHKAAVKALAWSGRQYNILATGAGTADRCLRTWDIKKKKLLKQVDTGSQICNLVFSKHEDEIISSHGFSNNEINIWNTKDLSKVATLSGHSQRVLYLSNSPDGKYIVTGAGDETLRFWDLNYPENNKKINLKNNNFFCANTLR